MPLEVSDILDAVDMAEYISQYTDLKEENGELWGLSPFKDEKTPSFSVRPETGYFYDCLDMEIKGTGKVEVHVDKINSKPLFVFEAKKQRNYKSLQFPNFDFSGNKDMYFIFTEKDIYLYSWFLSEFIP